MKSSPMFYTLACFDTIEQALVLQLKLTSEGVYVFLKDATTIALYPLAGTAIGAIKLQVLEKDKQKAIRIYKQFLAKQDLQRVCPYCSYRFMQEVLVKETILTRLFPFFYTKKYKCNACKRISK